MLGALARAAPKLSHSRPYEQAVELIAEVPPGSHLGFRELGVVIELNLVPPLAGHFATHLSMVNPLPYLNVASYLNRCSNSGAYTSPSCLPSMRDTMSARHFGRHWS